jgi:hypothetical protein
LNDFIDCSDKDKSLIHWYRIMVGRNDLPAVAEEGAPHVNNENEGIPPPPPPPIFHDGIHPTLAQFMGDITRQFTEAISRMSQPVAPTERIGCSMRDFTDQQFRTFNGTQGHTVAEAWISDIQLLHDTLKCTNEERLKYTVLRLTGEALKWWKSQVELIGPGVAITWERFVEEFNKQYFPRSQKQSRAIEFQNLVQGTMTVEQYSIKFTELARFGINLIPDEVSKTERFENGLNSRIKERVVCHEIKNYARLVNVASLAERAIRETSAAYEHRKRSMPQASYPSKRFVVGTSSEPADHKSFPPSVGNQKVACPNVE